MTIDAPFPSRNELIPSEEFPIRVNTQKKSLSTELNTGPATLHFTDNPDGIEMPPVWAENIISSSYFIRQWAHRARVLGKVYPNWDAFLAAKVKGYDKFVIVPKGKKFSEYFARGERLALAHDPFGWCFEYWRGNEFGGQCVGRSGIIYLPEVGLYRVGDAAIEPILPSNPQISAIIAEI